MVKAVSTIANEVEIPSNTFGDFEQDHTGVWFEKENRDMSVTRTHVCSPLWIRSITRNSKGEDWGKELLLTNIMGHIHSYHLRMTDMSGSFAKILKALAKAGLRLGSSGNAKSLLQRYLHEVTTQTLIRSSQQPGWVADSFVLPNHSFGPERVLLSSDGEYNFRQAGTLKDWKKNVASLCPGNSRLLFGASVGFAAPLLRLVGLEGGGFHVCGSSSTGKSTTLQIASSIYGSAEEGNRDRYLINWDTTKGALETSAESLNDCLFACDELGLVDGSILGNTLYMLANGTGKGRMGEGKRAWRIMMFTSGEVSINEHMATAGKQTKLGQEVRLLQIAADAGHDMGLFENIHGFSSPAEFSNHIKKVTSTYYGEPLKEWIKGLVADRVGIAAEAQCIIERFKAAVLPGTPGSIAPRAAQRFGAVAAAGEIATRLGLTGWKAGEAFEAALTCFGSWKDHLKLIDPAAKAVERVRQFIVENETSFVDAASKIDPSIGYTKKSNFLVMPSVFREVVCSGVDYQAVAVHLEKAGYLLTSGDNRQQRYERIQGKLQYFYVVKETIKAAA